MRGETNWSDHTREWPRDKSYRDGNPDRTYRDSDRNRSYRDGDRNRTYRDRYASRDDRRDGRRDYYRDNHRRWDRDWRRDNRYDWRTYRTRHRDRYRIGRYYSPYSHWHYRRLTVGFFLDTLFYSNRYWISDPWYYRLPPAYGPYRWVRYYDDALLVNIYTGEVVDVIYDFFW